MHYYLLPSHTVSEAQNRMLKEIWQSLPLLRGNTSKMGHAEAQSWDSLAATAKAAAPLEMKGFSFQWCQLAMTYKSLYSLLGCSFLHTINQPCPIRSPQAAWPSPFCSITFGATAVDVVHPSQKVGHPCYKHSDNGKYTYCSKY